MTNTDAARLTAQEVADLLGIKRPSVYRMARRPGFPQAKYTGRTPTWNRSAVEEWRRNHPARAR